MKRRISIFTLLLCTFFCGLATAAFGTNFYVFSNKQGTSFQDWDDTTVSMQTTCPDRVWSTGNGPIKANTASGLRFKGWYTRKSGWTTSEWPKADDATDVVTVNAELTVSQIEGAGKLNGTTPVVVAKYVPIHAITGVANPEGAGSVTGGGTVDEGGSVKLTAKANTGWEFSQWSDGVKDNPRTISGIRADATYTAVFRRLSVDKPKVTTSFTYDGTQKTCASAGSHYTVTGNTGTNAGDYTFTAKLESGYTWSDDGSSADYVVKWKINTAAIESVALATVSATYDGNAHQPVVNSVTAGGKVFSSASAGWTVAYTRGGAATSDFTSAGTITVTVTGKAGLSGSASATFNIAKKTISTTGVGFSDKSVTYDGTVKSITASSVPDGVKATCSNNSRTDAGSQTATVNFEPTDKENCTVSPTSKTATLTVNPAQISAIALSATSATYDGAEHKPTVKSVTANGQTFTDAAIGWDVAYDTTDFTSVGKITVTANGKNNLTGSANATFEIKSKSITITFDPNGGNAPLPASKTVQCPGTYGTLPTPTRKGYDFTGWWTVQEGGTQITETTTVELTAAQTLYAHWEAKKCDLTIDPKGGLFNRSTKPTTFEGALTFDATNMNVIAVSVKEDGTPFLGYYTSGGVKVYDDAGKCVLGETYWDGDWPDGKYVNDGNLTVEARWSDAPRYDISVEADPAKGTATGGGTFETGTSVTLTATPNNGYAFAYWQREVSSIVSTDNPYEFTASSAAAGTYTAVFTGKVYKVTCLAIFGSPPSQEAFPQMGMPWVLPTATREGYDFAGWRTEPMDGGEKIIEGSPVTAEPPKYLYDSWTEKKPTIIYADPSYENTWITNSVDKGHTITNAEARTITKGWPARRDYKYWIKGWDPALPLTVAGDTTITAVWESYADVLGCPGLEVDVHAKWFVDTTPKFYMTGDSCLKLTDIGGDDFVSVKVTEPGEFTFNWKAGSTTTALYVNEPGSGGKPQRYVVTSANQWTPVTIQVTAASKETPAEIMFQPSGQEFDSYLALDAVTWTQAAPVVTYEVTYDKGNSGTGEGRTDTKTNGVNLVLADVLFTRDNYTQEGWSKNADGTTKDYALKGSYTEDAAIILYPYWLEKGKYTVSYSAGTGSTGSAEAQTAYEGEPVILHGDGHFLRTGYSQDGWATSDLGEKAFVFDDPYDRNVSTNLYPCWTNNRYTVTFNPNGGSVSPASKVVTYDEAYGDLPTLDDREGFKFVGWALASGDAVTAETIVKTAADHKLIAKWENDVGELSRILDCDNLKFVPGSVDGWTKCTDFWHKGDSCLQSMTANAEVKATITEPGTLTFWWRGAASDSGGMELSVVKNTEIVSYTIGRKEAEDKNDKWFEGTAISVTIDAVPVDLTFKSTKVGEYVAIDDVTWTPDRKEPEYADTDTPVTGFSMADGKLGFSFAADGSSTYHILGTNDVTAPWMSWPFVREIKAGETQPVQIDIKADEPKMFYRIRALK